MSSDLMRAPPARGTVARELFRTVGLSLRAEFVLFAVALTWATGALLYALMVDPQYVGLDMVPEVALPFLAVAFVAPLAVWKHEGPSRRAYHLAMPVPRGWHQLARNTAGLLWVLLGLGVYLLWMELMVLVFGGENSMEYARVFLGDDWQNRSPGDFLLAVWTIPAWQWAVPIVATAAVYLIASALVLAVDRPLWWVGGIWFLFLLVSITTQGTLERTAEIVILGEYGIATLLTGDTWQAIEIASLTTYAPTAEEQGTFDTILRPRPGDAVVGHRIPDLRAWLISVLLWMGAGLVGTLGAVRLRKEA